MFFVLAAGVNLLLFISKLDFSFPPNNVLYCDRHYFLIEQILSFLKSRPLSIGRILGCVCIY